jgi:hypothetical protein
MLLMPHPASETAIMVAATGRNIVSILDKGLCHSCKAPPRLGERGQT